MAFDRRDVAANLPHDCEKPWSRNHTSPEGFGFSRLWQYTQDIQSACSNDSRLYHPQGHSPSPQNPSLTLEACVAIAGSDWSYYSLVSIWIRLSTWKLPVFQLIAFFPRPPLGFWVQYFVIVHLLGDPIDTTRNLLLKLLKCQQIAEYWKTECTTLEINGEAADASRNWKALALITDAFGEWGQDDSAKLTLHRGLQGNLLRRYEIVRAARRTGYALTADRSTTSLSMSVAQLLFVGGVVSALLRTALLAGANSSSATVSINVEVHSIAFTALYFWIFPAVYLSSVIGVSQTESAIPRILRRFQVDLDRLILLNELELPSQCLMVDLESKKDDLESKRDDPESKMDDPERKRKNKDKRIFYGGVYSGPLPTSASSWKPWVFENRLPYGICIAATMTGLAVSAFVPPTGWNCRVSWELYISLCWLSSALLDPLIKFLLQVSGIINFLLHLRGIDQRWHLWITGIKDSVITTLTISFVITTQIGKLHKCSCYAQSGKTGLALPDMPDVAATLHKCLVIVCPCVIGAGVILQGIGFRYIIYYAYKDAIETYAQRDD